jgi:hypothetical protein
MRFYTIFISLLFASAFLGGCFNTPEYPNTPEIEFLDIDSEPQLQQHSGAYLDSIVIAVAYKDGDGDLGYTQAEIDSLRRMSVVPYNYLLKQYRKVDGKFVEFIPQDPYDGFFQRISPDKAGPIEGRISYNLNIYHCCYRYRNDTIRFEVQIKDRAGNLSNTVTTDPVVVNWL